MNINKKKIIYMVFLFLIILSMCGCGKKPGTVQPDIDNGEIVEEKVLVTFNYYEGRTESIEIKKGSKVENRVALRDNYDFLGWYVDSSFNNLYNFETVVNDDITLYAKWEEVKPITYEVTFDVEGINKQIINAGDKVIKPSNPTKKDYRFVGWYSDANLTTEYDFNSSVSSSFTLYAKWIKLVNVIFYDVDRNEIKSEIIDEGTKLESIIDAPTIDNFEFIGWYKLGTDELVDLSNYIFTQDISLIAKYNQIKLPSKISFITCTGYNEAATITFNKLDEATSYNIYLGDKLLTSNDYYLQAVDNIIRIDILGLPKGMYKFKVIPIIEEAEYIESSNETDLIEVEAYDRSGYAHFNYSDGVGAYNDDGSLKQNAIVLYVTDDNKNSVSLTYKGITVTGIGNILNSVGEASGDAGHETECKRVSDGKTYYGKGNTNQGILVKLAQDNIPLVIRFVGCVSDTGLYEVASYDATSASLIDGLTGYSSYDYGGSVGDNGHMARMKSAKNVTLEGVGEDAIIDGWGFHLICESSHADLAKSFEVRNLTFINTPEDAIGMEGQENESSLTITASVERCWIHHSTFIGSTILNPAESDKNNGDGSCDFKRGRYFTCSYNYFEGCHKTNLVGSSKTSVQFCLTYHHNIWYNCSARQPLARHANIHFYNNFIYGTTDTASSLRANSYMYSEYNYYLGCSRPVEYKEEGTTGICKSFGNVLVGCYNSYDAYIASNRCDLVNSNCVDGAISYVNFDTNPNLFYFDEESNVSDCYITSADVARIECLAKSGSRYRTVLGKTLLKSDPNITNITPTQITADTTLNIAKGKGVLKVFSINNRYLLTISATSSNGYAPAYLLKLDGSLVSELSSEEKQIILDEGTYVLVSGQSFTGNNNKNDKEATITKCVLELYNEQEYNAKLINDYNNKVSLIPETIEYNDDCYNLLVKALAAYNKLGNLQNEVDNTKLVNGFATYKEKGIGLVEAKIDAIISPVTTDNANLVIDARNSLNELLAKYSDATISNLNKLEEAEVELANLNINKEKIECTFNGSASNDMFIVSGNYGTTQAIIDGATYNKGLKMESSTSLTFTTSKSYKLVMHITPGKKIKVDGIDYTIPDSGILVIDEIDAGDHLVTKNTTSTLLYYLSLEEK